MKGGSIVTEKYSNENKSYVENNYEEKIVIESNPPPPPPPLLPGEEIYVECMAHMSTHIPFYEGDEYPRRHWFLYESTWESNVVTNGE